MNRHTLHRGMNPNDYLELAGWLVVDSQGSMRMTRAEPATLKGEVAVAISLNVPMSLFRKPRLKALIQVPAQAGLTNEDAIQAVVHVIETGCDFEVSVTAEARPAPVEEG